MAVVRPTTTRAVVFRAPDDLRLEELPLPPLRDGEILLRITACGLCPGEVMDWYMARKAPVPLGHEPVGEVVEVGPGAPFRAGERVFVHHHAPCLNCRACRRGNHVHCATWGPRRLIPGGLAFYAVAAAPAPASDTLRLPPGLSDEIATFIEPLACVVKSVRRARIRPGDRVVVLGLG
ncbi:MAG: alcohol dehydrogenase catalytic domain-containing protein, partial [bacterium]